MSMLMITHDLGIVAEICDEVSVVYAGRVVEHGTLADVFVIPDIHIQKGCSIPSPTLRTRRKS